MVPSSTRVTNFFAVVLPPLLLTCEKFCHTTTAPAVLSPTNHQMSRARRPIHLYDDDFTFDEPMSSTTSGNGGRDLFTNSDHLLIPDSPLSKHVREFDTMLAANKSQQQQQRHPPPTIQPAPIAASDNSSGMASPDTPRTLAFRQKISSLGSACRNASARSAEARGQGRRH